MLPMRHMTGNAYTKYMLDCFNLGVRKSIYNSTFSTKIVNSAGTSRLSIKVDSYFGRKWLYYILCTSTGHFV